MKPANALPKSTCARLLLCAMLLPALLLVLPPTAIASDPENPVFQVSPSGWDSASVRDPEVPSFFGGSCIPMWYQGTQTDVTSSQIGFASSCDGINWTRSVENPVIVQDQPWKSSSIGGMSVLVEFNYPWPDLIYKMWYEGRSADGDWSIGYATSSDGIHWADHPDNPIIAHGPDTSFTRSIRSPTVLRIFSFEPDPESLKMWFRGSNLDFGGTSAGIGLATSADGISWTLPDAPLPSLSGPEFRDPDVLRLSDQRGLNYRSFCLDPIFSANHEVGGGPCTFYPFEDHAPYRPEIPLVGEAIVDDMNDLRRIIILSLNPFRMFYVKGTNIYQAKSLDALEWTAHQAIVAPDPLEFWKSDNVSGPSAALIDGELQLYFAGSPTGFDSNIGVATLLSPIAVDADVKPGTDRNPVNPGSAGIIPVAILGSDSFDAADVSPTTLAFAVNSATPVHDSGGHLKDVNADGLVDLMSHFRSNETGIREGDAVACLTGLTRDGRPFEGCDSIVTIPTSEDDVLTPFPTILNASVSVNQTEAICDITDQYRFIAQSNLPFLDQNQVAADLADAEISVVYSELVIDVHATDSDSNPDFPGETDILGVTATYVHPGQNPDFIRNEDSLVLFDDGSANKMSFTQRSSIPMICEESTGTLTCGPLVDFILTGGDPTSNDSHYTRRIPTFDLALPVFESQLLALDCMAQENDRVPLSVKGGETLEFRLDVVDLEGNITTWPDQLPATAQQSAFICRGDECLCCILEEPIFAQCSQLPGFAGLCSFF